MNNILETEVVIEIPFHDVDAIKVAWHGHYLKYIEIARTALYRSINYDCQQMEESNYIWPIIECNLRFIKTATYGMKIKVTASLVEYEHRVKIKYMIVDAQSGDRICKAYTVQVAVNMKNNEMCIASPDVLLERLGVKT